MGDLQPERPGADVIPLPQLERLPANPDLPQPAPDAPGPLGLDSRASRLEALELVRSAVELADRIERDAQDAAKDRLARADEEVRLRRLSLDEREAELERMRHEIEAARKELDRARHQVEQYRQQAGEMVQKAEGVQARAEHEAAEKIALATAQADTILEHAHHEAEARAQHETAEKIALATAQADAILEHAHHEAEALAEATRREAAEMRAQARSEAETERSVTFAEQVPELEADRGPEFRAEPEPEPALVAHEPPDPVTEARACTPESEAPADDPQAPSFTPPPVSLEDLAEVGSLPRFGALNLFRKR